MRISPITHAFSYEGVNQVVVRADNQVALLFQAARQEVRTSLQMTHTQNITKQP
jgi:hypothetical protein